jgi:putative two-component system response regulator
MDEQPKILIIDDEPMARAALEALLSNESYSLYFAEDGVEGLSRAVNLQPDVILLDVMMPKVNGFEVCRTIRSMYALSEVPILMITALDDRDSRISGFKAGADDFITKPFDSIELLVRLHGVTRLNRYRRIAEQRRELQRLHEELLIAYDETIHGWSDALDLRDKETEGHTQRVTEKTVILARAAGLNEEALKHIWRGSLLHDVGKLGIPDSILLKADHLTDEEWRIMRRHPIHAYEWLQHIEYLKPAIDIPYCHHEKWDGTGYPRGLKGEEIPIGARLFAIVDVWDALTSDRPYRKAMSREDAFKFIVSQSGTHFDPKAVELFKEHIAEL